MKNNKGLIIFFILVLIFSLASRPSAVDEFDTSPPEETQKLIFIHHSCGENWLSDDDGGLGRALGENNYFVSDTNYGWGPNGIGDATDIPDWLRWFRSDETPQITDALYNEFTNNWYGWEYYQRPMTDPGGENEIIMFKSCYPNSELWGSPDDGPGEYADWTVAGAKYVYNEILHYFSQHPEKLFIVITAPPNLNKETAENARAFNDWLVNEWLMPYSGTNIAVWDFYAVLSHKDNHHRFVNGVVEHTNTNGNGTAAYDSWGDPHPSTKGNEKATHEFIPMLNIYVNRWLSGLPAHVFPSGFIPETVEQEPVYLLPEETVDDEMNMYGNDSHILPGHETGDLIDNFDGAMHWEAFVSENAIIKCQQTERIPISEPFAMEITAEVPAGEWASCEYYFEEPRNFSGSQGIIFQLYSDTWDFPFAVLLYSGDPETPELFGSDMVTNQSQYKEWQSVEISWESFNPIWSENESLDLTRIEGIVFAFGADEDTSGIISIEDLSMSSLVQPDLISTDVDILPESEENGSFEYTEQEAEVDNQVLAIREQLCGNLFLIPFLTLLALMLKRKHA